MAVCEAYGLTADPIINLPRDQLWMITQCAGHRAHNLFAVFPINIAIEAIGMPRSFPQKQPALVQRKDFGMFFGELHGRIDGGVIGGALLEKKLVGPEPQHRQCGAAE
jgi:hypothetical protein